MTSSGPHSRLRQRAPRPRASLLAGAGVVFLAIAPSVIDALARFATGA